MEYPRVLVISNNSFSLSNSNGRTLGLLFKGWPKDKLAQFCISTDGPDWDICDNYFCASDRQVLKSTLTLHGVKRNDLSFSQTADVSRIKRIKRTPIKSLVRHLIWYLGIWRKGDFETWVKAFFPEVVIIQSGDTAFTHDLARKIVRDFNARLCFFNTEGIFFMKENYLFKGFCDSIFFPLYHHIYQRSYIRAMQRASYAFYLNDLIKCDNDSVFDVPGMVIYNTSSFTPTSFVFNHDSPVISYFGNFGYGRSTVLVEVADIIKSMGINSKINVYGKGFSEVEDRLKNCDGILFHGFVPYEQIREVINGSDIVLHVESQEPTFSESLRYGFSTKIADCLSSGKPFLLYAPREIACSQYLIANDCAWFANTRETLKEAILSIIDDGETRNRRLAKAKVLAAKNHSMSANCEKFQRQLIAIYSM